MITQALAQEKKGEGTESKSDAKKDTTKTTEELRSVDNAIKKQEEHIKSLQPPAPPPVTWWSTTSAMTMSATVLVFGLLTLCLVTYVLRRGLQWEAVLKIFGMVLIIVMSVFLVVAGYDDKQIAGAVALLGTIAGYLLAKDVPKGDAHPATAKPSTGKPAAEKGQTDAGAG